MKHVCLQSLLNYKHELRETFWNKQVEVEIMWTALKWLRQNSLIRAKNKFNFRWNDPGMR
jgi:hypothetical protein